MSDDARTRLPLTVVVPVRNEAVQIASCVGRLARAGEVIIVDGGSDDGTPERARAAGAVVLSEPNGTIASQRNAGIARATHPWVLALDADERVTDALWEELGAVLAAPAHDAYRIRRRNLYLGREQRRGRWGRDWVVRLFRGAFRFGGPTAHPALETGAATIGALRAPLDHEPYRNLSHHLAKMDLYARWGARDLWSAGRRAGPGDLVLRPLWRFIRAYMVSGGWRDGRFGFVTATLGAYTGFLKYAHLWALERHPPGDEPGSKQSGG